MKRRILLALALVLAVAMVGLSIAEDARKPAEGEACCAQGAVPSCCPADAGACCALASDQKRGCSSGAGCPLAALFGLGKTVGSGRASGGCASAVACSDEGFPKKAERASGKARPAKVSPIVCPVSGEAASKAIKVAFNGGDVFLRCGGCKAKFEKDPQKYDAKANLQLVSTGQAVQLACPVSGGKLNKDVSLHVGGVDVGFFCAGCRAEVAQAKADRQVELVFGNEAFKKSYQIKKQPPQTEQAETQPAKQQPETEQPEQQAKKEPPGLQANKEQPEESEKTS